jgi:hypothetical protein
VLESPLVEFTGWNLAVDCGAPQCRRDRLYNMEELAGTIGRQTTIGVLLRRLRCRDCGGRPSAVFLQTGPEMAARGRARRVALTGPEERVRPDWP